MNKLEFEEVPDYKALIRIFEDLMVKKGFKNDLVFDWCLPVHLRGRTKDLAYNNNNHHHHEEEEKRSSAKSPKK